MRLIRRFAREVAERFDPDKIILFGSYGYGTPHADSDVDILVVMPCRNQLDQAVKISLVIDPPFPLDIIVRTPYSLKWRLAEGESFHTEITTKGKVLYEKEHAGLGRKSRKRLSGGPKASSARPNRSMTSSAFIVSRAPKSTSKPFRKNSAPRVRKRTTSLRFCRFWSRVTRRCADCGAAPIF